MQDYDSLNVSDDIKKVLKQYNVDFVFQPIFARQGELVGYEALMRPKDKNIMEFIEEMTELDKLHDLELLTYFGATLAYRQRGYDIMLSINSFPSECFSEAEALEYSLCFRPIKDKLIIEILEYTREQGWTWEMKKKHLDTYRGIEVALDDFGTGTNGEEALDYYRPDMIKVDRTLITDIDKDIDKQTYIHKLIKECAHRAIVVLAEGVETKEEYDFLCEAGVDYFQGYYLGRPA